MQLAPTKWTPIGFPRFSAGVSKSNEIWWARCDSSFLLPPPPRVIDSSIPLQCRSIEIREIIRHNSQISLLIPSTISSLVFEHSSYLLPAAENPRIVVYRGEQVRKARWSRSTLRRKAKPQPLLVRNVWSDRRVYTRGLVSRGEAPSCPTGQTTSRTIARVDEGPRAGASETDTFTAREVSGAGAARRRALSAVGPVPRKEALFH